MKQFSSDFNFLHIFLFAQADRLPGSGVGLAGINQWRADGRDGEIAQPPPATSQTSFPDIEMCSGAFDFRHQSCFVQISSVISAGVASTAAGVEFLLTRHQTSALRVRLINIL